MASSKKPQQHTPFFTFLLTKLKLAFYISLFFALWLFLLFYYFPPPPSTTTLTAKSLPTSASPPVSLQRRQKDECDPDIAPFFIYDLPHRFNHFLLRRCSTLNIYTNMCPHVINCGLGQQLERPLVPSTDTTSWHATHQFLAEMAFHARAERHPCRTFDWHFAELVYVPFYGGLYASSQFRESNHTLRDALALDLARYLTRQSAFQRRRGRDHFLALGRTAWDFMRKDNYEDFGANKLLLLPETANMSVLTVERHPWEGKNQYGIPYISYFHPQTAAEVVAVQAAAKSAERTHLFTFVGGPRPPGLEKAAARAEILRQCGASNRCLKVECPARSPEKCHDPSSVIGAMRKAEFCMQPPGDSFTRRSVFDSVLAGCVPVFFSEHTAYTQYRWYVPAIPEEWSVLIRPDRISQIEAELDRFSKEEVKRMRERVIELIPSVTYAHPNASRANLGFRDAVDIALVQLTKMVRSGPQDI